MKKGLKKEYNLGNDIKFVYKNPIEFFSYYNVYYGYVHNDLYFHKSNDCLLDKANYLEGGYFIYDKNCLVGGVMLFQNYMTDLFVIPPYDNYRELVNLSLTILEKISDKSKPIKIDEIADKYTSYYENSNYDIRVNERWMFMIGVTKQVEVDLPAGYKTEEVESIDEKLLSELLYQVYGANEFSEEFYTCEEFLGNIRSQITYKKTNSSIYNSSRVVIDKSSNEVAGMILMMEDEGLPFITDLVVSPAHQKKGIGSLLLRYAQNALNEKYSCLRLSVNASNTAVSIYRKTGFVGDKVLTNYKYSL